MSRLRPLASAVLVALACGAGPAPEDAARAFWQRVERGDPGLACRPLPDGAEVGDVAFGETLENERSALVETSLTRRSADGELRVTFHTRLARSEDRWQVDCDATRAELAEAAFVGGMREFGDALGRGARELGEALDQGVREMNRALRDALEGEPAAP